MPSVDLNADLGEGFGRWDLGDDQSMLEIVTSANVACGFHAGDPVRLAQTCADAAARAVRVGAQVGYRDLAGFGRRYLDVEAAELTAEVIYQIGALQALAHAQGTTVRYVKPHGALYTALATHREQARAVARAVHAVQPGSVFFEEAERLGLRTVAEVFADRAYRPDGTLVSRREPGSVLRDSGQIADRVAAMLHTGTVTAVDGSPVALQVESICVHGDSPGAIEIARAVRRRLVTDGVTVAAFT